MTFQFSLYASLLLVAAVIAMGFAWYAFRRRQQTEALIFGLLILAISWWSVFYALHIFGADLETQHLFNRIKYIGIMAVPPLWLILALQYTKYRPVLNQRILVLIFLPAMLLLPIVLTDHLTHLWWPEIWLAEFGGLAVLKRTHGIPYYIHTAISYLYTAWGLWLYLRFYRRTRSIYRSQSVLLIVATAIPAVANTFTQLELSPIPWGLDCFSFTLSGLLLAIAIFRYRFLDIVPVARRAIIEQIPDGVIVMDDDGRVVDTNPAAQALMGAGTKAVTGQPLAEAVRVPELRQALLALTQPGGDHSDQHDVYLSGPDGYRVLSLSTTPLFHERVGAIGQIILLRDISERVAAQREAETLFQQTEVERERLALTIGTARDAIVLLGTTGEVLASNAAARTILKAESSDRFTPALQEVLDLAQAALGVTSAEIEIGEQSYHVAAARVAGSGLILTMQEITHFKQLARLKDEFVSTVTHDLRTPLTSILGYVQIAQMEIVPEQERRNALRRVETLTRRMSNLIVDLLDLATIEAGVEYEVEPVDLGKLALEAIEDLGGVARVKGLTIQHELEAHPALKVNPRLVKQVWHNLIDNAIKHTDSGTITIRVKVRKNQVLGQVTDTGAGIASVDLPYIFDKFYRARHSSLEAGWGTGLGLALVKSVIEQHGGQVSVESELGHGSTFAFTLPLQVSPKESSVVG